MKGTCSFLWVQFKCPGYGGYRRTGESGKREKRVHMWDAAVENVQKLIDAPPVAGELSAMSQAEQQTVCIRD